MFSLLIVSKTCNYGSWADAASENLLFSPLDVIIFSDSFCERKKITLNLTIP